jgi:hypothetical protein
MPRSTKAELSGIARGIIGVHAEKSKRSTEIHRRESVRHWADHPWNFLSGTNPDTGKPLLWTRDEKEEDERLSVKPFPSEKDYLRAFVGELDSWRGGLFVPKSRQMIISTTCCCVILHDMMFHQARRNILSKVTEKGAQELLRDKVRFPWKQLPLWLRQERPLTPRPQGMAACTSTSSYLLAVSENAAAGECRGGSAGIVLLDEACFQDNTPEIFEAAKPMAQRIWVVSSPQIGSRGGRWMKAQVFDEEIA